jgi:hypothetical protein
MWDWVYPGTNQHLAAKKTSKEQLEWEKWYLDWIIILIPSPLVHMEDTVDLTLAETLDRQNMQGFRI